jgi:hypothetical protein
MPQGQTPSNQTTLNQFSGIVSHNGMHGTFTSTGHHSGSSSQQYQQNNPVSQNNYMRPEQQPRSSKQVINNCVATINAKTITPVISNNFTKHVQTLNRKQSVEQVQAALINGSRQIMPTGGS